MSMISLIFVGPMFHGNGETRFGECAEATHRIGDLKPVDHGGDYVE